MGEIEVALDNWLWLWVDCKAWKIIKLGYLDGLQVPLEPTYMFQLMKIYLVSLITVLSVTQNQVITISLRSYFRAWVNLLHYNSKIGWGLVYKLECCEFLSLSSFYANTFFFNSTPNGKWNIFLPVFHF